MARYMVTDSLLDAIILRSLDARDEMVPPWELRPDLVHGSLGWRMGAGEALLLAWKRWLDRQPTQRTWRVAYFRRHVAPRTWTPVVVRGLVEGAEDERHAIVERERCVADDVAYAAWVRRGEPPLFRPLHGGDSALGVRECAFWLRLARLRRRDAAWLASHEVPEEWPASRVAPIDKVSLAFTIILAGGLLGEQISWKVGLGTALMIAGALLTIWK